MLIHTCWKILLFLNSFCDRRYIFLKKEWNFRKINWKGPMFFMYIQALYIIFILEELKKKVKSIFLNIQHSRQECLNSCDSSHQFSLFKCMSFALGKRHESQAKYVLPELCFSNKLQPASLCLAQILIAFHLNSALVPTFQSYYLLANFRLSLKTNVFIEEHLKRSHFGIKDAE